jgi:RHS repeat-associated protein
MPDSFDFRFSSEYLDPETGLVYYGFRYYSPELGRWMSRDPIGELAFFRGYTRNKKANEIRKLSVQALMPPYLFVSNSPQTKTDYLGLWFNPFSQESYDQNPEGTVSNYDDPPPQPPGTFASLESGFIVGAGFTQVECCDENNCKKRMLFSKFCFGAIAHVGGSAGVHNLKGKSCNKDAYKGLFLELSAGPVEFDIGYTNSGAFSGTVEGGLSGNVGITTIGSAKWCYYIFDSEEILGCCGQ